MLIKAWIIFFIIIILFNIQAVSMDGKDNIVSLSALQIQELNADMKTAMPGTATVTIISPIKGYDVYVDGSLSDTEGYLEPLDGQITIYVNGGMYHNIKIIEGNNANETTAYFGMDKQYRISL